MTAELSWTTHDVETNGESIYYEVTTPAAPLGTVVFGHGGAGSHAVWFEQVPVLAARYRVITWDTRGFGGSTLRSGGLTADGAAEDLAAVLDDAGVEDATHLVAQSMGGWWTTAFALRWPTRVRSLTYSGTTGGVFTPELEQHFAGVLAAGLTRPPVLGQHFAIGAATVPASPARAFLYQQMNTLSPPPPSGVGSAVQQRWDAAVLRALGLPILFTVGSDDPIYPPSLVSGVSAAVDADFEAIEGAGHSPYFEAPSAFNGVLERFLSRAEAR